MRSSRNPCGRPTDSCVGKPTVQNCWGSSTPTLRRSTPSSSAKPSPGPTRLLTKNIWRVELQSKIDRQPRLRRILVVPRGKLGALDPKLRRFCEIWVADKADILRSEEHTSEL